MLENTHLFAASRPTRNGSRPGFTLIGLLVVISITAVLISMLLPALSRARSVARAMKCQAQMRQLGLAMHMYINDHDGTFPSYPSASAVYSCWDYQISSYLAL